MYTPSCEDCSVIIGCFGLPRVSESSTVITSKDHLGLPVEGTSILLILKSPGHAHRLKFVYRLYATLRDHTRCHRSFLDRSRPRLPTSEKYGRTDSHFLVSSTSRLFLLIVRFLPHYPSSFLQSSISKARLVLAWLLLSGLTNIFSPSFHLSHRNFSYIESTNKCCHQSIFLQSWFYLLQRSVLPCSSPPLSTQHHKIDHSTSLLHSLISSILLPKPLASSHRLPL